MPGPPRARSPVPGDRRRGPRRSPRPPGRSPGTADGPTSGALSDAVGAIPPIPLGGVLTVPSPILDDLEFRGPIKRSPKLPVKSQGAHTAAGAFARDPDARATHLGAGPRPHVDRARGPAGRARNGSGMSVTGAASGPGSRCGCGPSGSGRPTCPPAPSPCRSCRLSAAFPTDCGRRECGVISEREETHPWPVSARRMRRSSSSTPGR